MMCSFSFAQHSSAIRADYSGKNFWLCFPQNARSENGSKFDPQLYVAGEMGTKVQIQMPNSRIMVTIDSTGYGFIHLDTSLQVLGNNDIRRAGIQISSSRDISLFAINHRTASTDSYAVIPTNELGTMYRGIGYTPPANIDNLFNSQIDVIATSDSTHVLLVGLASPGSSDKSVRITLNAGEVYQYQSSKLQTHDVTGIQMIADKPVAFFTGHSCAQVPNDISYCNILVEQEPPVKDWGKTFLLPTLEGKERYTIRVVADSDETEVLVGGERVATLHAGEYYENDSLDQPELLRTSKPSLVAEYSQSSQADSVQVGDPFLMLVTPIENYLTTANIVVPFFKTTPGYNIPDRSVTVFPQTRRIWKGQLGDSTKSHYGKTLSYATHQTDTAIVQFVEEDTTPPEREPKQVSIEKTIGDQTNIHLEETPNYNFGFAPKLQPSGWLHYLVLTGAANIVGSIQLDGHRPKHSQYMLKSVGNSPYVMVQLEVPSGLHTITADEPFGIYSYGFCGGGDNYDSYGTAAGELLKVTTGE